MLSLSKKYPRIKSSHHSTTHNASSEAMPGPKMVARDRRPPNAPLAKIQKATYYFDASWHTGKTLRHATTSAASPSVELGLVPPAALLMMHTDILLWSIRPGAPDDGESKRFFMALLNLHLSSLEADEIAQFQAELKEARYDCYVTEPVIDDELYLEHGFSNGPPHVSPRTLLTTQELHQTLESLQSQTRTEEQASPRLRIPPEQAQALRDQLARGAAQWGDSQHSLRDLNDSEQALASLLDISDEIQLCLSAATGPRASSVCWSEGGLMMDRDTAETLRLDASGQRFARVQRDLLESLLLQKFYGDAGEIRHASSRQRLQVWRALEQIEGLAPTISVSAAQQQQIRELMAARGQLGRVQISPTVGAALGHGWIAPSLSLTPDQVHAKQRVGTLYMRSGGQVQPHESVINEWPIRWLSAAESEELYPAREAWHQPVAVDAVQLNLAAETVIREWKADGVRYRFAEVSADKPATGCRISVWDSVRRGMTPLVRDTFDQFNQGLPAPDSPTELWERLRSFIEWMEKI